MKNKIIMMMTFLATVGVVGNVFASPIKELSPNYVSTYSGQTVTSVVPAGGANTNKLGGGFTGEIISLNASTNSFIVKDQYDGITATVLTDPGTMASLRLGGVVTVAVRSGSTLGQLVRARNGSTAVPAGMGAYNQELGVLTQTNMGIVKSVNAQKNVVVIQNKHCGLTTSASVDTKTMALLNPGDIVSVKVRVGNPKVLSMGLSR